MLATITFTHAYQNCVEGDGRRERVELVGLTFLGSFPINKQSPMYLQAEQTL